MNSQRSEVIMTPLQPLLGSPRSKTQNQVSPLLLLSFRGTERLENHRVQQHKHPLRDYPLRNI